MSWLSGRLECSLETTRDLLRIAGSPSCAMETTLYYRRHRGESESAPVGAIHRIALRGASGRRAGAADADRAQARSGAASRAHHCIAARPYCTGRAAAQSLDGTPRGAGHGERPASGITDCANRPARNYRAAAGNAAGLTRAVLSSTPGDRLSEQSGTSLPGDVASPRRTGKSRAPGTSQCLGQRSGRGNQPIEWLCSTRRGRYRRR